VIYFLFHIFLIAPSLAAEDLFLCPSQTSSCNCPGGNLSVAQNYYLDSTIGTRSSVFSCLSKATIEAGITAIQSGPVNQIRPCPDVPTSTTVPAVSSDWIFALTNNFPTNCGYDLFTRVSAINLDASEVAELNQLKRCGNSMCTEAVFLTFIKVCNRLLALGKISQAQRDEWVNFNQGPVFKFFNDLANPKALVEELNIGTGQVIRAPQIAAMEQQGWPNTGDFVQIWRSTRPRSGHSVVFASYLYTDNTKQTIAGLCYWSSSVATNGYGKRCEPIDQVESLIVGRISI
jgi:hypothetical protein